jgi:3-phosphoshikimate 1-carboxyvinyltransferase
VIIRPAKQIRGRLNLPGDKSISHRAAIIASIANGPSRIKNFSTSEDCAATLRCLQQLGVSVEREGDDLLINGVGLRGFRAPSQPLDCGNSGTTMRLLAGVLAGQDFKSILTGDDSLRARPMQRIIEPLQMMGANVSSADGRAPLTIQGGSLQAIDYELLVASAQVKSCILLAGLHAHGRTKVMEKRITRDHTERMLRWFGAALETGDGTHEGETFATVAGQPNLRARAVEVPGDISSAAYFLAAAALLEGSALEIDSVGLNPTRTLHLDLMKSLGVSFTVKNNNEVNHEPIGDIYVEGSTRPYRDTPPDSSLILPAADIPPMIDELPLLSVVGSQIEGGITIRNADELRFKESDRIAATCAGLQAMGAEVDLFHDGLRVSGPTRLHGARIDSHGDHRIAMTFAVAGLLAKGETEIQDAKCVGVSFPEFFALLDSVAER